MILLKANLILKTVFFKMIKTMDQNVKWTEIFVINNNDIILAGEGRSLSFNFDNKRVYSNIAELPIEEDRATQITQNELLENTLNVILYAFGKWGEIKGLKVEKDYNQLNRLVNNILDEIEVEAILTKDNFRFYKDGVRITYEEVIQTILDKSKPEEKQDSEEEAEVKQEEEQKKYEMGLWHNMHWTAGNFSFVKGEISESDRVKSRLGNEFYMVKYKCPVCGEKLYMVVFLEGKEFRIETEEEAVYMARAYTCSTCNHFYTPKPQKLLMEGDVYNLAFEDDRVAYEDYLELLGRQGVRTSNCNFNEYESTYNRKNQETPPQLEEICNEMDSMSEKEIMELKDKMESGFYPLKSVEKYNKKVDREIKRKKRHINKKNQEKDQEKKQDKEPLEKGVPNSGSANTLEKKREPESRQPKSTAIQRAPQFIDGKLEKQNRIKTEPRSQGEEESGKKDRQKPEDTRSIPSETSFVSKGFEGLEEILSALLKGELDFFAKALEKLSPKQLGDLKIRIGSEQELDEEEKQKHIKAIDRVLYKGKSYTDILAGVDEIKNQACADSVKNPILKALMELLKKSGEKELEYITSHIPQNVSRAQYKQLREKMEQYKEMDNSPHKKYLEDKRDAVEKQEITAFIKRANAKDRKSLFGVCHKVKEQDWEERNVNLFLEKIQDRIYAMDEAAIKKICPDPADITFDEGLQAYEEISSGDFLPELKLNVLGMIEKRLRKLKMDECEQLGKKLSKDMKLTVKDYSRIHFYDVRKMMKGDTEDAESQIMIKALNTYAVDRGKYEFPIVIGDASLFANGKAGFVLTADHIFYNGLLDSGVMGVMDIDHVSAGTRLFRKGIYIKKTNAKKVKISNALKSKELKAFAMAMNDFIAYLKEKPESRNISYMEKEKHAVKCCYRCGYVYQNGNVCPKCGGKFNE